MDHISIKELNQSELPLLLSLFDYHDPAEMIASNLLLVNEGTAAFYAIFCNGSIVGEVRAKFDASDPLVASKGKRAYLYALRIHKDYRRMGLATGLMTTVIDLLLRLGYTEITIGVEDDNTVAHHLYESLGFNTFIKRVTEEYQGDKYEYSLYLRKVF